MSIKTHKIKNLTSESIFIGSVEIKGGKTIEVSDIKVARKQTFVNLMIKSGKLAFTTTDDSNSKVKKAQAKTKKENKETQKENKETQKENKETQKENKEEKETKKTKEVAKEDKEDKPQEKEKTSFFSLT